MLFLDSTKGFSAARLAYFVQRTAAGPAANAASLLSEVHCVRAFDVHNMLTLLDELSASGGTLSLPDGKLLRPSLVVVDSVSAVLSPLLTTKHYQGANLQRSQQPRCADSVSGHAQMLSLAGALRGLAEDFSLAVLCTNHTVGGRDGEPGSLKPALGETWKSQRALLPPSCFLCGLLTTARSAYTHPHVAGRVRYWQRAGERGDGHARARARPEAPISQRHSSLTSLEQRVDFVWDGCTEL